MTTNIDCRDADPPPFGSVLGIRCGDMVWIGDGIKGMVEELILARGMAAPFVLDEYWHDGHLVSKRFHAADCRKFGVAP